MGTVPSGTGEGRCVEGKPGGSEGHERGGGTLGVLPPHKARRGRARGAQQPARSGVGRPTSQRHPASLGCRADDHERTDPRACCRFGRTHQSPNRQGQSDRARGVQPPRQELPRHHDHAGAAPLTLAAALPSGGISAEVKLLNVEGLDLWRELGLVYRRDRSLPRAVQALITMIRESRKAIEGRSE